MLFSLNFPRHFGCNSGSDNGSGLALCCDPKTDRKSFVILYVGLFH